jgi:hypothetical protein
MFNSNGFGDLGRRISRSFYRSDPFRNRLYFIDDRTLFTADLL